eukprot:CAMPEP_0194309770 /NCGR_PEP_ID=MMETSP0171-20130528/6741_1 /TAXON_ID=218684 /ORGANISM="Corethron pennatum, Strain L29A3" /LENGTH=153 /DNA_ID=CAMNT_0039063091 /DNA_START=348 /DNA_END=809 /DNA_ORIENTATION=+
MALDSRSSTRCRMEGDVTRVSVAFVITTLRSPTLTWRCRVGRSRYMPAHRPTEAAPLPPRYSTPMTASRSDRASPTLGFIMRASAARRFLATVCLLVSLSRRLRTSSWNIWENSTVPCPLLSKYIPTSYLDAAWWRCMTPVAVHSVMTSSDRR